MSLLALWASEDAGSAHSEEHLPISKTKLCHAAIYVIVTNKPSEKGRGFFFGKMKQKIVIR
jgi:hypothetical protein